MLNWRQQIAVVTGGSRGVGACLVEQLVRKKAAYVCNLDIRQPKVQYDTVKHYLCDVSRKDEVDKTAREISNSIGHPTILINNAGIIVGKTILDIDENDVYKTLNTNLSAHFWTTKAFLPEMIKKNDGHVVFVASVLGHYGLAQGSAYAASKAGVISFHDSVIQELRVRYKAPKVQSTLVCPGYIETGLFSGIGKPSGKLMPALTPEYVAEQIINTALEPKKGKYITIPLGAKIAVMTRQMTSDESRFRTTEMLGLQDPMSTFVGRKEDY